MSVVEPGSFHSRLIERVKALLLRPSQTWEVIAAEPATVSGLYRDYILPLAAIPPAAEFLGRVIFGFGRHGWGFDLVPLAVSLLVQYGLTLGLIYVLALIIDGLANAFEGQRGLIQALKLAAYSFTAVWVAGVFNLIPTLSWLSLLGLYSVYLLYRGLPRLMRSPEDKAVPYVAVVILISMLLYLVIFSIASPMQRMGTPFAEARAQREAAAELKRASQRAEAAAARLEQANKASNPDEAQLPTQVGDFRRTQLSSGSGSFAGIEGSVVTGEYEKPGGRLTLVVTNLGRLGALAAFGDSLDIETSDERDGGYEKLGKVDGRMTLEEYEQARRHGSYAVLVGERYMVQAEGEGVSMDELKAAVQSVDFKRLEQLAAAE